MHRFIGNIIKQTINYFLQFLALVFLGCIVLIFYLIRGETITQKDATRSSLIATAVRICDYYEEHGIIADSLTDLPKRKNYHDSIFDGWNRPILYFTDGAMVRLLSYGKDGVPGGTEDDADLECLFNLDTNTFIRVFEVEYNTLEHINEEPNAPMEPAQAEHSPLQTTQ